jgi:hypothetical protein
MSVDFSGMNINYKRGFQRVYAVFSVLWVAGVAAATVGEQTAPAAPPGTHIDFTGATFIDGPSYWISRAAIALLPPAAGYVALFLVFPWITRGFRAG